MSAAPKPYGERYKGTKRIDRASERDKAKAEERKRLAEALRANLKRRKAARSGKALDAPAPEASAPEPPQVGKE